VNCINDGILTAFSNDIMQATRPVLQEYTVLNCSRSLDKDDTYPTYHSELKLWISLSFFSWIPQCRHM